jgi:hypothetical protein
MDSFRYGAHADMLGARFSMRAAEDGHLTLLRAHAAVANVGCCCCHPPNACKCHRGKCRDRALRGNRAKKKCPTVDAQPWKKCFLGNRQGKGILQRLRLQWLTRATLGYKMCVCMIGYV